MSKRKKKKTVKKEILVAVENLQTRAAIIEDGKLVELYVERSFHQQVAGSIYKGVVKNVLPGMQASFVDVGLERNAFLYVDDVQTDGGDKKTQIADMLKPGQQLIVQVAKEPIGSKGARVVSQLSIPGRYLVLVPDADYTGISRRIASEAERERLREAVEKMRKPHEAVIVRTAAEGQKERELKRDLVFLRKLWNKIKKKAQKTKAPAVLYKDHDLIYRLMRDTLSEQIASFQIDSEPVYKKILEAARTLSPRLRKQISLYTGTEPLFEQYGIEQELAKALKRRVWLDCGGYLVVDQTEALTVIDVNTGKFVGSTDLASTVLKTNLQAAAEIARQLRLRNLTGIIVVDFIDMEAEEDRKAVLKKLEEEVRADRVKTNILGFTRLGLVEITRKKVQEGLGEVFQKPCPYCEGTGRILSEESMAIQVERQLRQFFAGSDIEAVLVGVHPQVAAMLIGLGGSNLGRLEEELNKKIFIKGCEAIHAEETKILLAGTRQEVEQAAMPVSVGQKLEVTIERPHLANNQNGIARLEGYIIEVEGAGKKVGQKLDVEITKTTRTYAKGKIVRSKKENSRRESNG